MRVQVEKLHQNNFSSVCLFSKDIFEGLKLSKDILYNIHFGQLTGTAYADIQQKSHEYLFLPEHLFDQLVLSDYVPLNIWIKDKEIFLGPVVGIFETPWTLKRIVNGKAYFYEIQHMQASIYEHCLCYYFSIEGINWEEKKIRGITFIPEAGKWKYCMFPMPNVIYDEGIYLRENVKSLGKQTRKQFRNNPNIHLINSRNSFGKWELCERLSKYPDVKGYIPETVVYTKFTDAVSMLNKHSFIFLKSFSGSKGEEVLSIEKINRVFRINYCEGIAKEIILKNIKDVEEFVEKFVLGKNFIIQKGIRLLKYQGRKFDLRVLLQKDENGVWKSTYNAARIARKRSNITNHAAGGDIIIFEKIYPYLKSPLCKGSIPNSDRIIEAGIKIATYLETEFGGSLGEIGMDLAIDIFGDIWIIEANAKPDKFIDEEIIDLHGERFIDTVLEVNEKNEKDCKNEIDYSKSISPAALPIFKYSKYLAMNKEKPE